MKKWINSIKKIYNEIFAKDIVEGFQDGIDGAKDTESLFIKKAHL